MQRLDAIQRRLDVTSRVRELSQHRLDVTQRSEIECLHANEATLRRRHDNRELMVETLEVPHVRKVSPAPLERP
jgi:hypothetical protein